MSLWIANRTAESCGEKPESPGYVNCAIVLYRNLDNPFRDKKKTVTAISSLLL